MFAAQKCLEVVDGLTILFGGNGLITSTGALVDVGVEAGFASLAGFGGAEFKYFSRGTKDDFGGLSR